MPPVSTCYLFLYPPLALRRVLRCHIFSSKRIVPVFMHAGCVLSTSGSPCNERFSSTKVLQAGKIDSNAGLLGSDGPFENTHIMLSVLQNRHRASHIQ